MNDVTQVLLIFGPPLPSVTCMGILLTTSHIVSKMDNPPPSYLRDVIYECRMVLSLY